MTFLVCSQRVMERACYAMLPIVFDQRFATTRTTTDISRSGPICVCRPRGKRLIMIFITNSVCATKTAASCNIPRAQLDDAKQTRPLSVYVRGVATPDYTWPPFSSVYGFLCHLSGKMNHFYSCSRGLGTQLIWIA